MKSLYRSLCIALIACFFAAPTMLCQAKAAPAILPESFAGWERSGAPEAGSDPRKIDGASSSVLTEDRFTDFEVAIYKHDERTITVRAARLR
jgi:hypothetical protein